MPRFVIAGTDTNIGKTVLSALLVAANDSFSYWKPVQSGLEDETDSETVRRLSECDASRIIPEAYKLSKPLSPHLSARLDGVRIDPKNLRVPDAPDLIIELAGGVLVPMNEDILQIDIVAGWKLPAILATRSSLGTINHTLLTLEALRKRNIDVIGCVPIGDFNPENEAAIVKYGRTQIIGRIGILDTMNRATLRREYDTHFGALHGIIHIGGTA